MINRLRWGSTKPIARIPEFDLLIHTLDLIKRFALFVGWIEIFMSQDSFLVLCNAEAIATPPKSIQKKKIPVYL